MTHNARRSSGNSSRRTLPRAAIALHTITNANTTCHAMRSAGAPEITPPTPHVSRPTASTGDTHTSIRSTDRITPRAAGSTGLLVLVMPTNYPEGDVR